MTIGYYIALGVVVFLAMMNGFLDGSAKNQIDAAISVVWVGLLLLGWYLFGWKTGLMNILLSLSIGASVRPLARRTATWFLAHPPK